MANRSKYGTLISNISVARLVMRMVSSMLGPLGMSRIVLKRRDNEEDRILLASSAATLLEEMRMEHPVAKLLAALAEAQKDECADGATTAVVLACSLLESAEELVSKGLHPSTIIEGYRIAADRVVQELGRRAFVVDTSDDTIVRSIVRSAIKSRAIVSSPRTLALFTDFVIKLNETVLGALPQKETAVSHTLHNPDNISFVKKAGASLAESELMSDSYVIDDREVAHPNMPRKVKNGSIALIMSLEAKRLRSRIGASPLEDMKVEASGLYEYEQYIAARVDLAKSIVRRLREARADVVLVNMGIDELVEHYLSRYRILAVKRVKSEDMELIARLTQGTVVSSATELSPDKLGKSSCVEEASLCGDDRCILVRGCSGRGVASLILRGSSKQVLDDTERCLRTLLKIISTVPRDPRVVLGGGSTEMELAQNLDGYALSFSEREQIAIRSYARSLESLPRILSQNAGLDPVQTVMDMRNAHKSGGTSWGIDAFECKIADMEEAKIFDLVSSKLNAVETATEVAISVLRISGIERTHLHNGGDAGSIHGRTPREREKTEATEKDDLEY